jgi:hypothetical protein
MNELHPFDKFKGVANHATFIPNNRTLTTQATHRRCWREATLTARVIRKVKIVVSRATIPRGARLDCYAPKASPRLIGVCF